MFAYEFSRDGDDLGWLTAQVDTPTFRGANGMWVQRQDVCEFASSLFRYPIGKGDPVVGMWGFSRNDEYTEVTKVIVEAAGITGGLAIDISLANYYVPTNRCSVRFETDYPALGKFADELQRMMIGGCDSAALDGFTDVR